MIVIMKRDATEKQIEAVIEKIIELDFDVHRSTGVERTILGVVGSGKKNPSDFTSMPGVKKVVRIT